MSALTYRPDIDGLRAVAVLSVVLFHAGVPFMTGGFVGVDVFFVISGYLITSLILKDLSNGTFTLTGFWERRARRILPALFVVIVFTAIVGGFILLPTDYVSLGKEIMAQGAFASNILFYKQTGYFDTAALFKPLLHTWSLAVEEQFYLFYPFALYMLWKCARHRIGVVLVILASLSLILCDFIMEKNPQMAFYMLPFRGWELLAGALVACYGHRVPSLKGRWTETLAMIGLGGIILPVFLYDDRTDFPGLNALSPVLGTAILIALHGKEATYVSRALSWRPAVWVGLISYSWYLWHWPVIVLAKYNPTLALTGMQMALCVLFSLALAVLTWRYVETPVRQKRIFPGRGGLYKWSATALIVLAVAGFSMTALDGMPGRFPRAVTVYADGLTDGNPYRARCDGTAVSDVKEGKICETLPGKKNAGFILWGDSQADAIGSLFFSLSKKYGQNGYVTTHHGCESIIGMYKKSWHKGYDCNEYNQAVMEFILRKKIRNVFLVSSYNSWIKTNASWDDQVALEGDYPAGYDTMVEAGLARTINTLRNNGAKVYLMLDAPSVPFDPPRVLALSKLFDPDAPEPYGVTEKDYKQDIGTQIEPFLRKYGTNRLTVLDPGTLLCASGQCKISHDGYSLYYNEGHLSAHGAMYLEPLFEPYFKKGF